MYDARTRWPRLTQAIARYMVGPVVLADDLADAADAVADYEVFRATQGDESGLRHLRRAIANAVKNRHQFTQEGS